MPLDSTAESLVYLLVATPFDATIARAVTGLPAPLDVLPMDSGPTFRVVGAERPVYLSDSGFVTEPDDALASTHFAPRLISPYNLEVSLFSGQEPSPRPSGGFGEITAANGDGALDAWLDYSWAGRTIRVLAAAPGAAYADFETVFLGTADGIEGDEERITIRLRDRQLLLDRPIQASLYGGTGGLDGNADLAGRPKPLAYGRVRNVTPVTLDESLLIYQVHDGAVEAIDGVRDRGVDLIEGDDYPDYAALAAATVGGGQDIEAGEYATCLAEGLFRLGGAPDGQVTCDVEGDASGAGYVETTADIVRRIVTTRLGAYSLTDPAALDVASFAALNAAQPATVGLYIDAAMQVGEAVDQLLAAVGGYWGFTRPGLFFVARLDAPEAISDVLLLDALDGSALPDFVSVTRATPAMRVNALGLLESASAGVLRLDHDPLTGDPLGWLIEEARTNLCPNSENFGAWSTAGMDVSADAAAAPDGAATADALVATIAGYPSRYQAITVVSATTYTFSIFAKAGNHATVGLEWRGAGVTPQAVFDLVTGTVASGSGRIEAFPNGWYRCSIAQAAVDTSELVIVGHGPVTENGEFVYVWGAQLEAGAFPTSYIPTTGSTATRDADVVTISTDDFGFNEDEGTLVVEWSAPVLSAGDRYLAEIYQDGNNKAASIRTANNTQVWAFTRSGGSFVGAVSGEAGIAANTPSRAAYAYKLNDVALAVGGVIIGTDTTVDPLPTGQTTLGIGLFSGSTAQTDGHICRVAYVPHRLPNDQLQAISDPDYDLADLSELIVGFGAVYMPGVDLPTLDAADIATTGLRQEPSPASSWRRRVGWARQYTVQGNADLAGSVAAAERELYGNEYRFATAEGSSILIRDRQALDVVTPALFDLSDDAVEEAARLLVLHGPRRLRLRVPVTGALFRFWLGDVLRISLGRFGLDAGRDCVVIGVAEDGARNDTILSLWG